MRKFLIATLGVASFVVMTEIVSAAPVPVEMSKADLIDYCSKKGGVLTTWASGDYGCSIGKGKGSVNITCKEGGKCVMTHVQVFTSPKPATHGPVGQAPASTLANGSKNSNGAGTAGAGTLAGNTSPNHPPGTNSNGAPSTTRIPAAGSGGGGVPLNGRPRLQQQ